MISFRDAGPDDAAMLAALARRTFTETFGHLYTPENLAAFIAGHTVQAYLEELESPDYAIRFAEADGEPIAYCKIGPCELPFEPEQPSIELRQLYVLKPWHGAGIAGRLMEWALAEARRRGAGVIYLSVFVDNHRARRFYARYGFEFVQTYAFMVGTHADEDHILRLRLEP